MNIQIYGVSKSFDTQKAERYFKERKIAFQAVDLRKYGLSKREFESVKAAVGLKDMIDSESKEYERLDMRQIGVGNVAAEVLFNNPKLYRAPIVRNGKDATVGYRPEIWKDWI